MKNIEEIKNNILIEVSSSSGFSPSPSTNGIIITKSKTKYYYKVDLITKKMTISDGVTIDNDTYQALVNYINNNLEGKHFPPQRIMDMTFKVKTDNTFISNYPEINSDIKKIIEGGN